MVGLFFFIRSPWGQELIVQKAVSFLSRKTQSEIRIDKLFFTFKGDLYLEGLFLADQKGDTLLYSQKLETGLSLRTVLVGDGIEVSKIDWEDLKANIKRDSLTQSFNFDFLLDAFMDTDDSVSKEKSEPSDFPNLKIGPISLLDFELFYDDQVLGIQAKASWDKIALKSNSLDLNSMDFDLAELLIHGSIIDFFQYKPFPSSEPELGSDETPLPLLVLDLLEIRDTDWSYRSDPDGIYAKLKWKELALSLPEADLENQKILLEYLKLIEADAKLELTTVPKASSQMPATQPAAEFRLPDWWIEVGNFDLENNQVAFSVDGQSPKAGVFNADAIGLEKFNFSAHAISMFEQEAFFVLDALSFREASGLEMVQTMGRFNLEPTAFALQDFRMQTSGTNLDTDLKLNFANLNALVKNYENTGFDLDLKLFSTNASELLYFQPELKNELFFKELMEKGIKLEGKLEGNLSAFNIPNLDLKYGENTTLLAEGIYLVEVLDMDKLRFDIFQVQFKSIREDVQPFMEGQDFQLPDDFSLSFAGKGALDALLAEMKVKTSDGDVYLDLQFKEAGLYEIASKLSLENFDLGKILQIEDLAPLSLKASLEGSGSGLYDVEGQLQMSFDQLLWNEFDFSELELGLSAKDTTLHIGMAFRDEFLDFDLMADMSLDSLHPSFEFQLDVRNLQTMDLQLTRQDINARMQVIGKVDGSLDDLRAEVKVDDGLFLLDRRAYPIGNMALEARLADFMTSLKIQSDFLKVDFSADSSLDEFNAAFQDYFNSFFVEQEEDILVLDHRVKANAKVRFHPTPFIDQLLVAGIQRLDTLRLDFDFDAGKKQVDFDLMLPMTEYGQAVLDSFFVHVDGNASKLSFGIGFHGLSLSPLDMGQSSVSGNYQQNSLNLDFFSGDDSGVLLDVKSLLAITGDTINFSIIPEGLVFNRQSWEVPSGNQMVYAPELLTFNDFSFSRNGQSIFFSHQISGIEEEHVGIEMENFELNTFFGFLNPDEKLVAGKANGDLVVVQPFGALGLLADLKVEGIKVLDLALGNLMLHAEAESLQEYSLLLSLKEGLLDMDLKGNFLSDTEGSIIDMQLTLNALKVELFEQLANGLIRDGQGFISGDFQLKGPIQEPVYKGALLFNEVSFVATELNNRFLMSQESIKMDNSGLSLDKFTIKDESDQRFVVDGRINTPDFSNIGFDLKLNTKDFQVLNSTRADSDLFFGKANVDLDMTVKGTLELPEIDVKLKVNRGTNVSFIVPESQLDLIERTGVVIFVNHQDPYDLLYQREMDLTTKGLTGYDMRANLQIDPQTVFNLIVDERTGDNLRLQGEADLNLLMNPSGDISLSGKYEVNSGHYELNLFGLVNRRFELAEGSFVSWNGDPLDANLDLQAIYNVRTSAAQLMQAQLSGIDTETRGQFRQVLPFRVYLKVGGEIINPEISFELDMPEQERGAFGGSVYSMLQQVNESEDELTKQVFSLLVLNQFFPMTGSDGASGGSVNLARSSVSQVLSSQMNALSDRLFGETGFSLDLDLDAYTDYQSGDPQDRTQLSVAARQTLMDDRLVISVGGQVDVDGGNREVNQGDALFGDVSVEYLLDSRGQWRAKAYRRNQFESVIDGQLVVTGISLIFNKEFNAFRELFMPLKKLEAVPQKEEWEEVITEEEEN